MLLILLLQAEQPLPDIELNATVRARQVTIEKQGNAELTVSAGPDGGSLVDVQAPKANGRKRLNNVEVKVRAEARIGDPLQAPKNNGPETETPAPQ